MNIAAKLGAAARALNTPWAILAGALLIALAVLAGTLSGRTAYMPNPQGGIWIRTAGDLFLCRPALGEAGPCVSLQSGATTPYSQLK